MYFFLQAEDGIRDKLVTGVQTCAVPGSHEDVRLAELDAVGARGEPRRAQDHEERVAVALELRPLVGGEGVLDREVVESDLLLDPPQEPRVGLVQPDPDEPVGLLQRLTDIGDENVADPPAPGVCGTRDDASHVRPSPTPSLPRRPNARQATGPVRAATTPASVLSQPAVARAASVKSAGNTTAATAPPKPPGMRHGLGRSGSWTRSQRKAASSTSKESE